MRFLLHYRYGNIKKRSDFNIAVIILKKGVILTLPL